MNGFFAFLTVPPGPPFPEGLHFKKMCGIVWCYTGLLEQANEILEPLRRLRRPRSSFLRHAISNVANACSMALHAGFAVVLKADFVNELSDEAIALHIKHGF